MIALSGVLENLVGFQVEETQTHSAMAHDALEMADTAATAILLGGVQRNHGVAAFPNPVAGGIDTEADAVAERPDSNQAVELIAPRREASRDDVGVVVEKHRRVYVGVAQL